MNVSLRFAAATLLLVLTVWTGMWTSHRGKPYPDTLFLFHKLFALSLTVYTLIFIMGLLGMGKVEVPLALSLLVGGGSFLVLFISGALLSIGRVSHDKVSTIHSFATILMIVTIGIFLMMMIWRTVWVPA